MRKKLLDYFLRIMPLTEEEVNALLETMTIKQFKKGSVLLKEGEISAEVYFVLEGCVCQYCIIDGEEKTNNFFTEEQWVVSINNFSNLAPSNYFLECCIDSTLVVGNREKEDDLYKQFPKFEAVSREVMRQVFMNQQEILSSHINETPEQRYLKLLNSRPDLFQKIPQYKIASYIGVKPETLSRIRKRIHKQGRN